MHFDDDSLKKFLRSRKILIAASIAFFFSYFISFRVLDSPFAQTILMVVHLPWMLFWVHKRYRCTRTIVLSAPYNPLPKSTY